MKVDARVYVAVSIGWMACGGQVNGTHGPSSSDDAGQTAPADGGTVDIVDARNPFIPSDGAPPVDDADPGGGTTDTPGYGFDFCFTRTPGSVTSSDVPPAAEGRRFLRFTPRPCANVCGPQNPSDAQLYAWPRDAFSFDTANGLYFEVIDLGTKPSSGSLRIYGTDEACEANVLMSDVPLADLAIERSWSTRCIPLRSGNQKAIGLAVTGGDYDIGIDAIRFGPVCR